MDDHIVYLIDQIRNGDETLDKSKIEENIAKDLDVASKIPSFYSMPFNVIQSIVKKCEFTFESDPFECLLNLIQQTVCAYEEEVPLLLTAIDTDFLQLSLEQTVELIGSFSNCKLCQKLHDLFLCDQEALDIDYHLIIQEKEEVIEELNKKVVEPAHVHIFPPITEQPPDYEKDIFKAARQGKLSSIQFSLEQKGYDKDACDKQNNTALHYACQKNHLLIVQYLIENQKANKEVKNKNGSTPLLVACENNNLDIVKYLMQEIKVNKNACDNKGNSAVKIACKSGKSLDLIMFLINDPEVHKTEKTCALHWACQKGEIELVKTLVEQEGISIESKDNLGDTPLHIACENNHFMIVKYLCQKGADKTVYNHNDKTAAAICEDNGYDEIYNYLSSIELSVPDDYESDIIKAIQQGKLSSVQYSLEKNKELISEKDEEGNTLLHIAIIADQRSIVEFLIQDKFYNVSTLNQNGQTPIGIAVIHKREDLYKYLEYQGAKEVPEDLEEDIFKAAAEGKLTSVQFLIEEEGISKSIKNDKKDSPISIACYNNHIDIVKYLLDAANINNIYSNGNTLVHISCIQNNLEMLKYLCSKRPDINLKNDLRQTPVGIATLNNYKDIYTYLTSKGAHPIPDNFENNISKAVESGNLTSIRYMYEEQGLNVNMFDQSDTNVTILTKACQLHQTAIVQYLCQMYADVSIHNKDGKTAYAVSYSLGFNDICDILEKFGANPKPKHFIDDIFKAVDSDNIESVVYLIQEYGVQKDIEDDDERTLLHHSCAAGSLPITRYLIEHLSADFTKVDKDDISPLHLACINNHLNILQYLVDVQHYTIRPQKYDEKGNNLMHIACASGSLDILVYLVEKHGFDITQKNQASQTPMGLAVLNNRTNIYDYLISKGIEGKPEPFESDPKKAIKKGDINSVKFLYSQCCSFSLMDQDSKNTPLHEAAKYGHLEILKYFVSKKPYLVYNINQSGFTVLHIAAAYNYLDIVRYLVDEVGMNPSLLDDDGQTPLHLAAKNGNISIAEYLIEEKHVNVNIKTRLGQYPLDLAVNYTPWNCSVVQPPEVKVEMIQYLRSKGALTSQLIPDVFDLNDFASNEIEGNKPAFRPSSSSSSDDDGFDYVEYLRSKGFQIDIDSDHND